MKGLMTRSSTRSSYASSHFRNYTPIQHTREAEHLKLTSNNKLYDMSAAGHVGMPLSSAVVVWYGIQSKAPIIWLMLRLSLLAQSGKMHPVAQPKLPPRR